MNNQITFDGQFLSDEELMTVNGGGWGKIITVIAAGIVAVYEVGKAVGETAYHLTH
ncbi:class IIb bacteriocin, lactobin A/cerein 7B family [Paenibacillus sp. FSL R7-0272]|uniref:class IIb bacteriocin, lactobin A/cerein 7B family n=1 Tax=Paenibacillus sp. FSL R7-0272 TaxID=2921679 RepID=UPI0030EBD62C